MLYASSSEGFKKNLQNIQAELQVTDVGDLKFKELLATISTKKNIYI